MSKPKKFENLYRCLATLERATCVSKAEAAKIRHRIECQKRRRTKAEGNDDLNALAERHDTGGES